MRYYENISIWRALACVGVLFYHIMHKIFNGQLNNWFMFGRYGVLFFFIITGFLAFSSNDIRAHVGKYWIKRAVRILPLYITVQIIWFIVFAIEEKDLLKGFKLLISDFAGGTWTIWVTIVFYFLAPLLIKVIDSWWKAWIGFLLLCVPRYLFIMYGFACLDRTWQYLCFCMQGVLAYFIIKQKKEAISVFLLAGILVVLKLMGSMDDYFICSIIFMILFIASRDLCFKHSTTKTVIQTVDKYSYNIFLVHPIVLRFIPNNSAVEVMIVGVLLTAIASVISFYCVDYPWNGLLKRKMTNER